MNTFESVNRSTVNKFDPAKFTPKFVLVARWEEAYDVNMETVLFIEKYIGL